MPKRQLALHVQEAIARGQGVGVQPRMDDAAPDRQTAAHVRRAIQSSLQAKLRVPTGEERRVAGHVQAAMAVGRGLEMQPKLAPQTVILMKPCPLCGKKKGHRSDCPRNPKRKKAQKKKKTKVHQENQSWTNLKSYRPGWVKRNDIKEGHVKAFLKTYGPRKIRGHASGDNSQGEQGNTTQDLNAFKSWFTKQYGWA